MRGVTLRRVSVAWSKAQKWGLSGPEQLRSLDSNMTTQTTNQVGAAVISTWWQHLLWKFSFKFSSSLPSAHFLSLLPVRGNKTTADLKSPVFPPSRTCQVTESTVNHSLHQRDITWWPSFHFCSSDEFLLLFWSNSRRSSGLGSNSSSRSEHSSVETLNSATEEYVAAGSPSLFQEWQFSGL